MRGALVVIMALGLVACGESDQDLDPGSRTYQGKRDGKPWDNAPPIAQLRGGKWDKGDQASWEEQIKTRQLAQHEHKRIYQ